MTDPLLQTVRLDNDLLGRVRLQANDALLSTAFEYDANSNLTALTPPGRGAHRFDFTSQDLLSDYVPPSINAGNTTTGYRYNLDKQLTQVLQPDGTIIDYDYNVAGKLSTITTSDDKITYSYASTGQLASINTASGQASTYLYDGFLLTQESSSGLVEGDVAFGYDNYLLTERVVVNGEPITYKYDWDGYPYLAGSLWLDYDYEAGLLRATYLDSITSMLDYNGYGELTREQFDNNGASLYEASYMRDNLGRITQKIDRLDGVQTTYDYRYDNAGRLASVKQDGVEVASYAYDSNGNRIGGFDRQGNINATVDAQDRLLTYNTTSYGYNLDGDLETKSEHGTLTTYDYDALGNLRNVVLPGDIAIDYVIDGRNRRVGKKVNGVFKQGFLYQNQLNPIVELDGNNNVVSRFVYASKGNVPDYMIKNGETYRIISDHLGSPRLVVNSSTGEIAQRIDYDEFGNVLNDTNPGFQPFGFAGGIYDQHTGLVRFGARDYDPQIGRWTAKDPIGFGGGDTNVYSYVSADPVNWIDPSGLAKFGGKGERGKTASPQGTGNPYKHMKPHPTDPNKVIFTDPHTGKKVEKPKPAGFDQQGGSVLPDLLAWLIPWWLTPSELGCGELDCDGDGLPDYLEDRGCP